MIAQGAEAKIYENEGNILKERVRKSYRIDEIDTPIRKSRTNREAKVLQRLSDLTVPKLLRKEDFTLIMEKIDGEKLRDTLTSENCDAKVKEIAHFVSEIHSRGIIHGDLTTSNMIDNDRVYFIDFGLSFFSQKAEDKAVDIHLLEEAFLSKHHKIAEKCINSFLENYSFSDVKERLVKVRTRGRNKGK